MSDYAVTTDFSVKDGLTTGDPEKIILGADFDVEFDAIVTAIATKYDSSDLASQAQAEALTLDTVLITPHSLNDVLAANGGMLGDIQALADPNADTILGWDDSAGAVIGWTFGTGIASTVGGAVELSHLGIEDLVDPNADRILFWDDGAGATAWLTVSTGLTLSGTSLTTDDTAISHDNLSGFVSDEHVAHSGVTLTAGTGLSGGGTIAASRTFNLDVDGLTNNIGASGAIDLDVDEVAIANATATEKCFASALVTPEVPTTVSGTTDTLAETDFGKVIRYSSTSTITVTLPNGLKTGFWCTLLKTGASGTLNLSATTTLNTVNSLTSITDQYGSVTVFHSGSNVWYAWGNLT
jgi:hypothetical protein